MDNNWSNEGNPKKKRPVTLDVQILEDIYSIVDKIETIFDNEAVSQSLLDLRRDGNIEKSPLHHQLSLMVAYLEKEIENVNKYYRDQSTEKQKEAQLQRELEELRAYGETFDPDVELDKLDIHLRWKRLMGDSDS